MRTLSHHAIPGFENQSQRKSNAAHPLPHAPGPWIYAPTASRGGGGTSAEKSVLAGARVVATFLPAKILLERNRGFMFNSPSSTKDERLAAGRARARGWLGSAVMRRRRPPGWCRRVRRAARVRRVWCGWWVGGLCPFGTPTTGIIQDRVMPWSNTGISSTWYSRCYKLSISPCKISLAYGNGPVSHHTTHHHHRPPDCFGEDRGNGPLPPLDCPVNTGWCLSEE